MAANRFKRFLFAFMRKLRRFVFSRRFVVTTGILTVLFTAYYATTMVFATIYDSNPSSFCGAVYQEFRNSVLLEGIDVQEEGGKPPAKVLSKEVQGETYNAYMPVSDYSSDAFEVFTLVNPNNKEYNINVTFVAGLYSKIAGDAREGGKFIIEAELVDPKGKPYPVLMGYRCDPTTGLEPMISHFSIPPGATNVPTTIDLDAASNMAFEAISEFYEKRFTIFEAFGIQDFEAFQNQYLHSYRPNVTIVGNIGLALGLSFLGAPIAVLFLMSWSHLMEEDKRFRLICKGAMTFRGIETAIPYREPGDPMPKYEYEEPAVEEPKNKEVEILPERETAFNQFLIKHRVRPVLGEWVFRGAGLIMVGVATLLLFIGSKFQSGTVSNAIFKVAEPFLTSANSTGMFILVIALVGVISETHKGLKLSTNVFLGLGLAFYFVVGALFMAIDLLIPVTDSLGFHISDLLATASSGNIFFGIGVFAMIGFFLFHSPPRWFINRRVFRALSAIPTSLAVASVAIHIAIHTGGIVPSYWVRNLLFNKAYEQLIVGVAYEYIIFVFRCFLSKRYGEENIEFEMSRPVIQINKNIALVGFIVLYSVVFYCIPSAFREKIGMPAHTYIYLVAPFFLFYKPAGQNHKLRDDVLYYTLYIVAAYLPTIITRGLSIFGVEI